MRLRVRSSRLFAVEILSRDAGKVKREHHLGKFSHRPERRKIGLIEPTPAVAGLVLYCLQNSFPFHPVSPVQQDNGPFFRQITGDLLSQPVSGAVTRMT